MSAEFYVYAYLRTDGTPYYIGKGKGKRLYSSHRLTNKPKDRDQIVKLRENLTEQEAFSLEKELIREYGRKDIGTGILHNRTDGGDGPAGVKHPPEYGERISKFQKGRKLPHDWRQNMSIAQKLRWKNTDSAEKKTIAQKISSKLKGHKHPPEYGERISQQWKNTFYITNGIINKRLKLNDTIPEGWYKGRVGHKHNNPNHNKNKIYITNGINNRMINKYDTIPVGWYKGRVMIKQ